LAALFGVESDMRKKAREEKRMNDEGKNDEKIQTAQTLEKEPKFRLDAIRWSPKDGHYQRAVGLRYSDDVDELVEFCRHPKKNGGFDRAVVYLLGADGSERIVENVHSVMGRLYCRGRVDFVEPVAGEEPMARKKRKSGKVV
jgi:hypothetical protein